MTGIVGALCVALLLVAAPDLLRFLPSTALAAVVIASINLANPVKRKADGQYEFDWQRYEETIRKTTRFLDNVIDMNHYPVPEIDQASKESRRIGLGVMGVADLLYKLRIPYNSKEGYEFQYKRQRH